jgi:hypothetical protein
MAGTINRNALNLARCRHCRARSTDGRQAGLPPFSRPARAHVRPSPKVNILSLFPHQYAREGSISLLRRARPHGTCGTSKRLDDARFPL